MKLRQNTKQVQKQIFAPVMKQSIEVLQLPIAELGTAIEAEMESNPVLESEDVEATLSRYINDIIHNKKNFEQNSITPVNDTFFSDDDTADEKPIAKPIGIEEHLLKQLRVEMNNPQDIAIGELLISYINNDGYFEGNMQQIAKELNIADIDKLENILKQIQTFDPVGIGARHLRECLLAQIPFRFNGHSEMIQSIIRDHLDDLAMKRFDTIARKLKISPEDVRLYAKEIATLEPKPARKFSEVPANLYIKPDIIITEQDDHFVATVTNEYIPQLRVSAAYKNMLNRPNSTTEETQFIKDKIKSALLFIKSIEQRQSTIKEIADYIVNNQQEFFKEGYSALKPMVLADIARTIGRNESTVSRAICNKYVDSPQGIFPLKYFFSQAVSKNGNHQSISNRSVKEELRMIVQEENKQQPFSDQEILEILEKRKMKVARRTVSKYRKELNILPSHLRKQ